MFNAGYRNGNPRPFCPVLPHAPTRRLSDDLRYGGNPRPLFPPLLHTPTRRIFYDVPYGGNPRPLSPALPDTETRRLIDGVRYDGNPRPLFPPLLHTPRRRIFYDVCHGGNPSLETLQQSISSQPDQGSNSAPPAPPAPQPPHPQQSQQSQQSQESQQSLQPQQLQNQNILGVLTRSGCLWDSRPFHQLPLTSGDQRLLKRLMSTPATKLWDPFQPLNFSGCPLPNPTWTKEIDDMMGGPDKPDYILLEQKTAQVGPQAPIVNGGQSIPLMSTATLPQSLPAASPTDREVLDQSKDSIPPANKSTHRQEEQQLLPSGRASEDREDSLPLAAINKSKRKDSPAADDDDEIEIVERPIKKQRKPTSSKKLSTSSNPASSSPKARTSSSKQSNTTKPDNSANSVSKPKDPSKKKGSWSESEHEAIEQELRALRADEERRGIARTKGLRDIRLWSYISGKLAAKGIIRTQSACKNYWSREGRSICNWDERAIPNYNQLSTSLQ